MTPADGDLRGVEIRLDQNTPTAIQLSNSFNPAVLSARGGVLTLVQAAEAADHSPHPREAHFYPAAQSLSLPAGVCASLAEAIGLQDFIKATSFLSELELALRAEDHSLFDRIGRACKKENGFAKFNFQSSIAPKKRISDILRDDFQSIQPIIGNEFECRAFIQAFDAEMMAKDRLDTVQKVELIKRLVSNLRIMAGDSFAGQMFFEQAKAQPHFERDKSIILTHLNWLKSLLANAAELQLH